MDEWNELKKKYKDLEAMESTELSKKQIIEQLTEAIHEFKLVELKKLKVRPAKELLDKI